MSQLMFMGYEGLARPVSERLTSAQIDIDEKLVEGRRKRRKLNPAQGEVRPTMRKCNVEFIV
ncbi:hypothetical protein AA0113_g1693 [Alternaria arborescens]|uniref:Uncharacterized protein n=1 Tax=Alternaria arborescens TaxID=156630 RepID=A0A4Q4SM78_9PLEO|nr:hypothetical protein AA0113_g1693 [Alternaria arborescens]